MFIIFNILVIALVLLIAYWWANQGLFSSLLHLLCVIAAGSIALGLWEWLTVSFMLTGGGFDDYAWGVCLVGTFVVTLFLLRLVTNKMIPANVAVPHWANLTFGGLLGAISGTLTLGILVIGCGFIQSTLEIMGFVGAHRSRQNAVVGVASDERMWFPVHEITYEFFGWLSVTSLSTGTPLRQWYPRLDWQAASLVRDSWGDGKGKNSLAPDQAEINAFYRCDELKKYAVKVHFGIRARDWGEQLTLSRSQIRLIGLPKDTWAEAKIAYPTEWTQEIWGTADDGHHKFDAISHYVTSVPGQEVADAVIEFDTRDLEPQTPKFIMIRGTRFRLPRMEDINTGVFMGLRTPGSAQVTVTVDANAKDIKSAVEVSNTVRPLQISTNNMPAGITEVDKFFTDTGGAEVEFSGGGDRPSRALMIKGIFEPEGTRIVRVDVSRESPASIYAPHIKSKVKTDDKLVLVDTNGRGYSAVGYFYERADRTIVLNLDYVHLFRTTEKLPEIPTSGGNKLTLLFTVTQGVTIRGLVFGDVTVGQCSVLVPVKDKPASSDTAPPKMPGEGG